MPFKKILRIGQHEEDEEIDEDEEKQVKILFPGLKIPATPISPELARELTGKPSEFRVKIKSTIKGIDMDRFVIKK